MKLSPESALPNKSRVTTTGNRILDALSPKELGRVLPHLTSVELPVGVTLQASNKPIRSFHFMTKGIASLVARMEDGAMVELALIGNEGVTATSVLLGGRSSPHECFVQASGSALRMPVGILAGDASGHPALRNLVLRFAQTLSVHTAQTAACNARHTLEQRLARWLLMARDRLASNELPLTHQFLSVMLGVRRPGVTVAARALRRAGTIDYSHGNIRVLDGDALTGAACECYNVVKNETRRLTRLRS